MPVPADQRVMIVKLLQRAIANHWSALGVPTLKEFVNMRRKTFMERMEIAVGATEWREKIAAAKAALSHAKSVRTQVENHYSEKYTELKTRQNSASADFSAVQEKALSEFKAKQASELLEFRRKQEAERNALEEHYQPDREANKNRVDALEAEAAAIVRASYFSGLGIEDDGRELYRAYEYDIDKAIRERVDKFAEENVGEDGVKVMTREHQTALVEEMAGLADKPATLRGQVLAFIAAGKLPPVTIEAWGIENGEDITVEPK